MHTAVTKEVIEMIQNLPAESTISDIMDRLYVRLEIEAAEREIAGGKGFGHEIVEQKIEQWLLR